MLFRGENAETPGAWGTSDFSAREKGQKGAGDGGGLAGQGGAFRRLRAACRTRPGRKPREMNVPWRRASLL